MKPHTIEILKKIYMSNSLCSHIISRLEVFGVTGRIGESYLFLNYNGVSTRIRLGEDHENDFREYINNRDSHFDNADLTFIRKSELDVPLVRLDQDWFREEEYLFNDETGDEVIVRRARFSYSIAFFDSDAYKIYFDKIVAKRLSESSRHSLSVTALFKSPMVATYSSLLAVSASVIKLKGIERIRACLAKLAIERHVCFELAAQSITQQIKLDLPQVSDGKIPRVVYERTLINYYKVGRASPFSSQSFLAYYHVLEYYFLRVSEGVLHDRLRALLNAPDFQSNTDGIDSAISLVRKNVASDDETEMLRKVLIKFVSEEDFIKFINKTEEVAGRIYSKKRPLFGEDFEISPREGHAISNAAKLLKHIRNAIVHSSDKYTRDERHIPLTESENLIANYIPVVKYFAEKVIFGTAVPCSNFI